MRRVLVLATVVVSLVGCKKPKEVDCGMAAKAWADLVHHQLDGDADAERRAKANAVVPALREELNKKCRDDAWPVATRRCIVDARTPEALEKCDPTAAAAAAEPAAVATEPAAPAAEPAEPAAPSEPAPASANP